MSHWKAIPEYIGMYEVSSEGDVRSLDRNDSRGRFRKGKNLCKLENSKGYLSVHLHKNGVCRTAKIHRLVAQCFLDTFDPVKQVDHIDGDRQNNSVSNLRMVLNSQNKANMKKISGMSSRFKGVYFHKVTGKWAAAIKSNGVSKHLGIFVDEVKAAEVYDKEAVRVFGEYAKTNKELGLL